MTITRAEHSQTALALLGAGELSLLRFAPLPANPATTSMRVRNTLANAVREPLSVCEYLTDKPLTIDCGNAFAGGNGPATNQGDCNMACNGNATEFCGGPNRLNVYQVNGASAPSSASTAATPTSTAAGSATGLPAGWTYKGCYVDNVSGRILSNQQAGGQTMTVESCVASCKAAGYVVAGMEYASECYCGNGLTNGGKLADADTQCNTNCAGNAAEKCGDANRMSIYSNAALGTQVAPGAQTTNLPGSWKYQGCIT